MLGLAGLLLLPMVYAFRGSGGRGRREAALALHRGQLAELRRDREEARIGPAEYEAAKLEVERRLLAADALRDAANTGNARPLLIGAVIAVPVAAFALYLPGSTPDVPSEPHGQWLAQQRQEQGKLAQIIDELRARLAVLDPATAQASEGQAYLGEALAEQAQTITPEALALFRQSLAHAPAGAAWRGLDTQRIAEATPP